MLTRCYSTLAPLPQPGLSAAARRKLADGRVWPKVLKFTRGDILEISGEASGRMSISGVQDKVSLVLERGVLKPATERGQYILKPVPSQKLPAFHGDVPANEHLTMQIASQVYGIDTAPNAVIPFADGELAYITRRFDWRDGAPLAMEDFCQLGERSAETHGANFKYDGSYEEAGRILKRHCNAFAVEREKFFRLFLFNYLTSNGDAHLKNFSLVESAMGDLLFSPAYDLLATSVHLPNEPRLALDLFADSFETEAFTQNQFATRPDFLELALRLGMPPERAEKQLSVMSSTENLAKACALTEASFLSEAARDNYVWRLQDRHSCFG